MTPIAIPSEMLYASGIAIRQRYAGIASVGSLKSISATALTIKNPTKIKAGAVANPGIATKTGDKKIAIKNRKPVTTDARPVLAPSATPEELSTNVVVVEVPSTAPAEVAIASASNACLIFGSFPSLSSISALFATPISVPNVSNMSTNKNAKIITTKSSALIAETSALKHCPNVSPIEVRSKLDHDGNKE